MEVTVVDNFFPVNLIDGVIKEANNYSWNFIRIDSNEDIYWTKNVYGDNFNYESTEFLNQFTESSILELWRFIANKYNISDSNLRSVYLNGLTNGVEAHQHIDANNPNEVTIICYLCENWNSYWGGETSFYSGQFSHNPADPVFYTHEIEKTVIPRRNRIVIFNSQIIHGVHPISKTFKGLRKTLMFKIKNLRYEQVIKNED